MGKNLSKRKLLKNYTLVKQLSLKFTKFLINGNVLIILSLENQGKKDIYAKRYAGKLKFFKLLKDKNILLIKIIFLKILQEIIQEKVNYYLDELVHEMEVKTEKLVLISTL